MAVSWTATLAKKSDLAARTFILPRFAGSEVIESRSRGAVLRPSFVARQEARPPEQIKGRRSAERRTNWSIRLPAGRYRPAARGCGPSQTSVRSLQTLSCLRTARLPALHRGTCRCDPAQLRS